MPSCAHYLKFTTLKVKLTFDHIQAINLMSSRSRGGNNSCVSRLILDNEG